MTETELEYHFCFNCDDRKQCYTKPKDCTRIQEEIGLQEMTNEEWFCGLSTEEKAEFIKKIIKSCGWCLDGGNPPYCLLSGNKCLFNDGEFVEWLKEKHDADK